MDNTVYIMIIDTLELHPLGREIITKIGESTGKKGDKFQNGLEKLKDTLDGDEEGRLTRKFE